MNLCHQIYGIRIDDIEVTYSFYSEFLDSNHAKEKKWRKSRQKPSS